MGDQEQKTKKARIARLAIRVQALQPYPGDRPNPLVAIIKGILDLLADEL